MEPDIWHERWSRDEIGFHQHEFNAHMQAFIGRLGLRPGAHIFVPLCGKSLDMLWLLQQGYRVSGIEISPRAVADFFTGSHLEPRVTDIPGGRLFQASNLDIFCADFFGPGLGHMAAIDAVYDRAALVALPPEMRPGYAQRLLQLLGPGVRVLLVTLDYPQHEMRGPPFAVKLNEVDALFAEACRIELLHSEDCLAREPRFREKGLSQLTEHVLLLELTSLNTKEKTT